MATITLLFWNQKLVKHSKIFLRRVTSFLLSNQFNLRDYVIIITWRDVPVYYTNLADQDRILISERREIIQRLPSLRRQDLRELGPFNTLVSCGEEPSRIRRRLEAIMSGVVVPAAKRFLASTPT
jgi:hypothetical protein